MAKKRAALRYAKALLDLAITNKSESEVANDMKMIVSTIAENSQLDVALKSPIIKSTDKVKVLNALFSDNVNHITKNLFNVLQDNKRINLLETVAKAYATVYNAYKNTQVAKVTTAVALTEELEAKIQDKIIALTSNKATIENKIDPTIIGGFILQVGDKQFDASIASKLNSLKKEFYKNY